MRLIASHSTKGKQRYRYYVNPPGEMRSRSVRIPATELERTVCTALAEAFAYPIELACRIGARLERGTIEALPGAAQQTSARLREPTVLSALVRRVEITASGFEVVCNPGAIADHLGVDRDAGASPDELRLVANVRLTRSGRALRLVQPSGEAVAPAASLINLLVKGRQWWGELRQGALTVETLAQREGVTRSYITRVARLAFLAPSAVEAVLEGKVAAELSAAQLTAGERWTSDWREQMARLLGYSSIAMPHPPQRKGNGYPTIKYSEF